MSDRLLISVIIPACRAETTPPDGVRGLLAQTYPSWQPIAELPYPSEEPARGA